MTKKIYEETDIQDIAVAIREQNDLTTLYKVEDMSTAIRALKMAKDVLPQDEASGSVANFPDGSNDYPVVELTAAINAIQIGEGDPSPSNPRPIAGALTVNLYQSGEDTSSPTITPISLGYNQIYGGTLNVTTGELTITDKALTFNGTESSWIYNSDNNIFTIGVTDYYKSLGDITYLCDRLNPVAQTNGYSSFAQNADNSVGFITTSLNRLMIKHTDAVDLATFKEWLSSNSVTVVYKLDTPLTVQLTPTQVNTILGVNNVWADTGDVYVKYRADVDLYIQKKLNE